MALELNGKKDAKEVKEAKAPVAEKPEVKAEGTYGEARKDLAFICPLGDPSQPDTTRIKDKATGTETKKVTSTIVGYRFKVLKDMKVPDCGTNENFKSDPMNFEPEKINNWVDKKAGEEVLLTPFETAYLLSQPQFNGGCDGGEKPVVCVYQSKKLKSKSGELATSSAAAQTPRVSLRAQTGSIKDFDIEDVLDVETKEVNGVTKKIRTMKDGYEKWAPLAAQKARKTSGGGRSKAEADPTKILNANAQAFLSFVNSKKAK